MPLKYNTSYTYVRLLLYYMLQYMRVMLHCATYYAPATSSLRLLLYMWLHCDTNTKYSAETNMVVVYNATSTYFYSYS